MEPTMERLLLSLGFDSADSSSAIKNGILKYIVDSQINFSEIPLYHLNNFK